MSDETNLGDGVLAGEQLSAKHGRFVSEYLKDGNASAAARRAGFSARSAGSLMGLEPIRAEIERRRAVSVAATDPKITSASLIEEAELARRLAEEAGNVSAMVAAIGMKGKLAGLMNATELPDEPSAMMLPADSRGLALAILSILREAGGLNVAIAAPGESLLRVKNPDAMTQVLQVLGAAEPAMSLEQALSSGERMPSVADELHGVPAANGATAAGTDGFETNECEIFSNGAQIQLVTLNGSGAFRWEVTAANGDSHGYRRQRADAVALALAIPAFPAEKERGAA